MRHTEWKQIENGLEQGALAWGRDSFRSYHGQNITVYQTIEVSGGCYIACTVSTYFKAYSGDSDPFYGYWMECDTLEQAKDLCDTIARSRPKPPTE